MIEYKLSKGSAYRGRSEAVLMGIRQNEHTILMLRNKIPTEEAPPGMEISPLVSYRAISPDGKMVIRNKCSAWNREKGNETDIAEFISQIQETLEG